MFGEAFAVERRDLRSAGVDEVGKGIRQPQFGGPYRALRRGAEQPGLRSLRASGQRLCKAREGMVRGKPVVEISEQLGELLREVIRRRLAAIALQGEGGQRVGAGGATEREVDATREQSGK